MERQVGVRLVRRIPGWLMIVLAVALVSRVAFVIVQLQLGIFDIVFDAADSALYRSIAENLLAHGSFARSNGIPTAYVTPGYPLFLASLLWISRSTLFIALVHSVLGAASAGLLAAAARKVAGPAAGLLAGLTAAVYPHLLFWTGYVTTETLYVFFIALSIFCVTQVLATTDWRWALATGMALGAGALTRPILLGFGLVLVLLAALTSRRRHAALPLLAGLVIVMTPWVIRNVVTLDASIVTSAETGYVLWQGNSPGATGGSRGYVDLLDFTPLDLPPGLSEVETDNRYLEAATSWMRSHPGEVARLAPRKLWNMFRPTYEGASVMNSAVTYSTYVPLLVLAVIGVPLLYRKNATFAWVLIAFLVYHLVVHGLVTGMIRFRLPLEAVLSIPAGIALASIPKVRTAASRFR